MISILLASRTGSNPHSNLNAFLDHLFATCASNRNFEVLVKRDLDDPLTPFPATRFPFTAINTPRLRGYADLHLAYRDLLPIARGSVIWVLSDDARVNVPCWDYKILDAMEGKPLSTLHFHTPDYAAYTPEDCVESPDIFPVWSRAWIEAAGFGPTFATDAWTALVQQRAFREYGVDTRISAKWLEIQRIGWEGDSPDSPTWLNERAQAHKMLLRGPWAIKDREDAAERIAQLVNG